ncbi:MAG: helix-turn-helix transcriptional regulator [Oscillospiraceae bacterium]|nr:helix-turn-helix transcriptional regulator [Oscillospiraceae bacterium]
MIYLNLKYLLKQNKKSKYWLVKQLDSNYTVINNMINNNTTGIRFETIAKLCNIFNCTPNELFITKEKE